MKNIERLAVAAIVLYLVAAFVRTLGPWLVGRNEWSPISVYLLSVPLMLVMICVNVAVAIWIFIIAKRHNSIPWVWALFGLVAGLLAPLLFYAIRIYDTQAKQEESGEHSAGGDR